MAHGDNVEYSWRGLSNPPELIEKIEHEDDLVPLPGQGVGWNEQRDPIAVGKHCERLLLQRAHDACGQRARRPYAWFLRAEGIARGLVGNDHYPIVGAPKQKLL